MKALEGEKQHKRRLFSFTARQARRHYRALAERRARYERRRTRRHTYTFHTSLAAPPIFSAPHIVWPHVSLE